MMWFDWLFRRFSLGYDDTKYDINEDSRCPLCGSYLVQDVVDDVYLPFVFCSNVSCNYLKVLESDIESVV